MPIDTPDSIRVRTPPSSPESGTPSARANRSQQAISSAAFAMLWPRTARNIGKISRGSDGDAASRVGPRNLVMMCHAVSFVSAL